MAQKIGKPKITKSGIHWYIHHYKTVGDRFYMKLCVAETLKDVWEQYLDTDNWMPISRYR